MYYKLCWFFLSLHLAYRQISQCLTPPSPLSPLPRKRGYNQNLATNEPMSEKITNQLDQLANYMAQRDVLSLQKKELIDQVLTPEIKARLEEIEAEFAGKLEAVEANINALEEEIRQMALQHGASVRGTFLQVVWHKGRVSWDTRSLDEYAARHPEISAFRKQGEPYVSILKR